MEKLSMIRSMYRPLERCFGRRGGDGLMWQMELKPHASGDFSIAVVQANSSLEDQSQVFTSPSATYVGVYDGHGGPEASRFVNRHLLPYLQKFSKEHGGLSADVIKKAFHATEEDFLHLVKRSFPVRPRIASVGSCCLVGAIANNVLYVANLGDSRAVLGRRSPGVGGNQLQQDKKVVAERLSSDHNVACEEVRKEVKELHPDDSAIVVYCRGVWRIKGIIQVSRSIGDVYLKKPEFQQFGNLVPLRRPAISAEPSIHIRELRSDDLFLIFASDGLWEHLSDEEAVGIVFTSPRPGVAKRLVGAALQGAAKKREISYDDMKKLEKGVRRYFHDDITVVVMYLDNQELFSSPNRRSNKHGCTSPPMDIFSNTSPPMDIFSNT